MPKKNEPPVGNSSVHSSQLNTRISLLKKKIYRTWKRDKNHALTLYAELHAIRRKIKTASQNPAYSREYVSNLGEKIAASDGEIPDLEKAELAEQVSAYLKERVDFFRWKDNQESIKYAGTIISIGEQRADPALKALGLMALGDSLALGMQNLEEAWRLQQQAADQFLRQGELIGWAKTVIGRVAICLELECITETQADARVALEIFKRYDQKLSFIRLTLNTMRLFGETGQYRESLHYFRTASRLAMSLKDGAAQELGYLYINAATTYMNLGEFNTACQYFTQAGEILTRLGKNEILNHIRSSIANIENMRGNYKAALELLNEILATLDEKNTLNTARFKTRMAECCLNLGRYREAFELSGEILRDIRVWGEKNRLHQAHGLRCMGMAAAELGLFKEAEGNLHKACECYHTARSEHWMWHCRLLLGNILVRQGFYQKAAELAREACAFYKKHSQPVGHAHAHSILAAACLGLKKYSAGKRSSRILLRLGKRKKIFQFQYTALTLLGQIHAVTGDSLKSRQYYSNAVSLLENLQRNLTLTLRSGFMAGKENPGAALLDSWLRVKNVPQAFTTLERLKGMVIMGYITNRRRLFWSEEIPESRSLLASLNLLRREYFCFCTLQRQKFLTAEMQGLNSAALEQKLGAYEKKIRNIIEKLYLCNAKQHHYHPVELLKLKAVRKKLPPGSCLLEYYAPGDKLLVFSITAERAEVHQLTASPREIKETLEIIYNNIDTALQEGIGSEITAPLTEIYKTAAGKLYDSLLGPLEHFLKHYKNLFLVPFGFLHHIPFNTLHTGTNFLIEEKEIAILPAAAFINRSGSMRKRGMTILAHTDGGRLTHVRREAESIAGIFESRLYLDRQAIQQNLGREPLQILHIAAHGRHRTDQPDLSYILLDDGYLYADDLLQKNLDYELVTLSGCETGKMVVGSGEEFLGLSRGVLYAGARSLVVSFWCVDDKLTTRLMEKFYTRLKEGCRKSLALQTAQRELLGASHQGLHPAFWGAFQLIGSPAPLIDSQAPMGS